MSETNHSPEPWRLDPGWGESGACTRDEVYGYLFDASTLDTVGAACGEADARRIVACVNACAGIPIEEVERIAEMVGERRREAALRHAVRFP